MIVTVHLRQVTIWQRDYPVRWEEAAFDPLPSRDEERPSGVLILRPASRPVRVEAPYCRLLGGRLEGPHARLGWDATTVLYLARLGRCGLRFEPPPADQIEASIREVERSIEAEVHAALTGSAWAVSFRSRRLPNVRSYAARDPRPGHIDATNDLRRVKLWADPEKARSWLAKVGLTEGIDPVPVGSPGWLYAHVDLVDVAKLCEADWPHGVEWSMREPGARGRPSAPAPREAAAHQLLLFGEGVARA